MERLHCGRTGFVTSRAPSTSLFIATKTPRPLDFFCLLRQRQHCKDLMGHQHFFSVAGRIAPTRTTGFSHFTVKSKK